MATAKHTRARRAPSRPSSYLLLVVDENLPLVPLIRTLAEGGYAVIDRRDGRLAINCAPANFRAGRVVQ